MRLVLQDGFIHIVNNDTVVYDNIVGDVELKYVPGGESREILFSMNKGPFKPLENGKVVIRKEDIKTPYINLVIKAIGSKDVLLYKADTIPLKFAILFGETMDEVYPEKVRNIDAKVDRIEETSNQKLEEMKEISRNILDYVEELKNRGSLF